jgi:glucose/arabinose dehydrogenase
MRTFTSLTFLLTLTLAACAPNPLTPTSAAIAARPTAAANPPAVRDAPAPTPALTFWDCTAAADRCPDDPEHWAQRVSVPPGFTVRVLGRVPEGYTPSALAYGPDEQLYVALLPRPFTEGFNGAVYRYTAAETWEPVAENFWLPTGLAFAPDEARLYVSSRAGRFEGQLSVIEPDGRVNALVTGLPCCYSAGEHQPNGLVFGPDGWLYIAIGARSDHGEPAYGESVPKLDPLEAGVLRVRPDGKDLESFASGLRNPYGLDFDLVGQLWADDNGPDFGPPERLHQIEAGGHYGFPYYADCAECPTPPADLTITAPYVEFPPHATPTGLTVYKGSQFPLNYVNSVLVALWNPGPGGRVVRVYGDREVEDFVTGLWGPVDVVNAPDGSVVIADNLSGYLFSVAWAGE